MNFSLSSIAASFVFGVFGLYVFKYGRKHTHWPSVVLGISLMVYPYLIENLYLMWGVGFVLTYLAYRMIYSSKY